MSPCPKEIDRQFGYLDVEEAGTDSQEDRRSGKSVGGKKYRPPTVTIAQPSQVKSDSRRVGQIDSEKPKGPGKTTFAERVKLFQNLGKKPPEEAAAAAAPEPPPQALPATGQKNKKIAFLDLVGRHEKQETTWKEKKAINNGSTLPTIAEAATPSSDKALLREEDDELPAILRSAEQRRSDHRHNNMHGKKDDLKFPPKPNCAEDEDAYYQEIDSEEYENCPYCNNEYSISTGGVCSTCESCTCDEFSQNGEEEERKKGSGADEGSGKEQQSFGHSIAANSWNFLNSDKRSDEDNDEEDEEEDDQSSLSAAESVINLLNEVHQAAAAATAATPSPTEKPLSPEHNLRRQLKEAFGRSANSPVSNGNPNNNDVVVANFSHHVSNGLCDGGDKKLLLPILPTDFLSDYASRKELGGGGDGAVLLREGETVRLTEEMFRGGSHPMRDDVIIPKNVIARKQQHLSAASENGSDSGRTGQMIGPDSGRMAGQIPDSGKGGKKKATGLSGSEMGDSGISSPPPFGAPPSLAISPRPPIAEEDSGVEGEQLQQMPEKKIPLGGFSMLQPAATVVVPKVDGVPVRKRDTMIRELKSKLRERFRQNGDSDDGTMEDASSGDDCSAKNVVGGGGGKGLVESRRESIGPMLGKIFAGGSGGGSVASGSTRFSLARSHGQSSEGSAAAAALATPPALPPKVSISRNESARSNATTTFKSIYESRMINNRQVENVYFESNASTVYDPSLPEELKKSVPAGLMFRDASRPLTPPPDLPAKSRDGESKAMTPQQQQQQCVQGGAPNLGLGSVK